VLWNHLRQRIILQTGHWESIFPKSGWGHGQSFSFYL
jgi:hypothetical protein